MLRKDEKLSQSSGKVFRFEPNIEPTGSKPVAEALALYLKLRPNRDLSELRTPEIDGREGSRTSDGD